MPGLSEEILFDTDEVAKALEEEEDNFSDEESDNDDFNEMMENDGVSFLEESILCISLNSLTYFFYFSAPTSQNEVSSGWTFFI
jgi:hypothetical protein